VVAVHVPVHVGGIAVYPGDLLHGDRNGVTTIPREIASEIAYACADYVAAEAVILNYLRSGPVTPQGLAQAQAEAHRMMDAIRQRVAKRG
jgi:regulator of RNase E activity RraA